MVVARIECKPEGLGVGDECWVDSNVVQNGLRTGRYCKEMRTKMKLPFLGVLGGPERFWLAKLQIFVKRGEHFYHRDNLF